MVEKLRDSFLSRMNDQDIVSDEHMYSLILSDLEAEGMLPPYCTTMRYLKGRSGEPYFSDDKIDGFKWEPEV